MDKVYILRGSLQVKIGVFTYLICTETQKLYEDAPSYQSKYTELVSHLTELNERNL